MQARMGGNMKLGALARNKTRMTAAEYQAHLTGINIFFGAVLGFVINGIERLDAIGFGVVLTLISGVVISILYISASKHRLLYSVYTLLIVGALPWIIDKVVQGPFELPPKLQPTLFVWTLITIFAEFLPRQREDETSSGA